MLVKLFKKTGTYVSKEDKKEKRYSNFYVQCGDKMIPVEVSYFPSDKFDGRDPNYNGRKQVLEAFAELLPESEDSNKSTANSKEPNKPTIEVKAE